jgi:hypothetical protein
MANPDIRVRLSAEGVQEVVGALRQIANESKKTGEAGKHFGVLGEALGELKELLPAIGIAVAVEGMIEMGKRALETADNMGKLAAKVGATTETLSVLSLAATTADVDQEKLSGSLQKLSRSMQDAASGSTKQVDAFKRLGISMSEIKNQDPGEMFVNIANKIQKLPPGANKAATAMALFGKSGADLMPLLNDLADGGFEKVREKAEKMGLIIDQDLVEAATRANDAMTDMKNIANGLAMRFMSGLAPAIADAMETFNENVTGKGTDVMKTFGKVAGAVIQTIISGFVALGSILGQIGAQMMETVDAISEAVDRAKNGDLSSAAKRLTTESFDRRKAMFQGLEDTLKEQRDRVSKAWGSAFGDEEPKAESTTRRPGGVGGGVDTNTTAIAQARLAFLKAQAENELAITKAKNKLVEDENKRAYDNGLISVQEYYDKREALAKANAEAELKALNVKLKAAKAEPADDTASEIKKQQEIASIQTQIAQKKLELEGDLKNLSQQRVDEEKKRALEVLDIRKKIADVEGDRWTAAALALEKELKETDELLKKQGVAADQRAEIISKMSTRGNQEIDFNKLNESGQRALSDIQAKQSELQDKVAHGLLFQAQADQQLIEYEKQRLPQLQKIADEMLRIGEATNDPQMIDAARQLSDSIKQIGVNVDEAGRFLAQFKATAQESLISGLTNFFTNGIREADSFGEAVRNLALSVIDSLEAMAAQAVATKIVSELFNALGGGQGQGDAGKQVATAAAAGAAYAAPITAASAVLTAGGATLTTGAAALSVSAAQLQAAATTLMIANSMSAASGGFADGGLVSGPGTGTSDSIPARLSDGEFVVRSAVVSQPGVLEHLSTLNRGGMIPRRYSGVPRFADGGLVSAAAGQGSTGGNASMEIGLDEGLILKRLTTSPDFARAVVRVAAKNKNGMSQALGRG